MFSIFVIPFIERYHINLPKFTLPPVTSNIASNSIEMNVPSWDAGSWPQVTNFKVHLQSHHFLFHNVCAVYLICWSIHKSNYYRMQKNTEIKSIECHGRMLKAGLKCRQILGVRNRKLFISTKVKQKLNQRCPHWINSKRIQNGRLTLKKETWI